MSDQGDGWYYSNGTDRKGPVQHSSLPALADAGVITSDTKVWREGMGEWEPAFKHVRGVLPPPPVAPPAFAGSRPPPLRAGAVDTAEHDWQRKVGFNEASRLFFRRYVDFAGRSTRAEFWWWILAAFVISFGLAVIDFEITGDPWVQPLGTLFALGCLIPNIALSVRRLHDTDKTGWLTLLLLVPVVGWIALIVLWAQPGTPGHNRFG